MWDDKHRVKKEVDWKKNAKIEMVINSGLYLFLGSHTIKKKEKKKEEKRERYTKSEKHYSQPFRI